ncbi:MAG: hypothetical protein JST54_14000 [Deltaproteobacteria bacterium]|nr:hypothetical protein [Deltaproteobacteria bacterium]
MIEQTPTCAEHPDQHMIGACARCGRFVCPLCSCTDVAAQRSCLACGKRREGDLVAHPGLDLLAATRSA